MPGQENLGTIRMEEHEQFLKCFLAAQASLKAFVFALVRDRNQGEEIFQEIALTLCRNFHRYDRSRPFAAWARGIARNKIRQWWAQSRREAQFFSPDALDAVEKAYERAEEDLEPTREALRYCLDRLPDKSKRLLALRYESGLKLGEIAEKIGRTLSAVHKSLSRLRGSLETCIKRRLARGGFA